MRYLLALILLVVTTGCGSNLRPDVIPASIASNYPTAEFFACGKHFQGLGFCDLAPGQNLTALNLSVQTYYQGTVVVDSPDCNFNTQIVGSNSQAVPISLPGTVNTDCTIGFTFSPQYPNEQKQAIVVNSFRGFLRVRAVEPGTTWQGFTSRIKLGEFQTLALPATTSTRLVLEGCGIHYDGVPTLQNGVPIIDLKALGLPATIETCNLAGILVGATAAQDYLFDWMISVYAANYIPLPHPSAVLDSDNNLSVIADVNTSVVALDGNYNIDSGASFDMDPTVPHTLRALTVNARSAIADWNTATQKWVWISDDIH